MAEKEKTIMIVDDSIYLIHKLKTIFEKNGFKVVAECKNGHEAIEQYSSLRPDLVTMDIIMPDMDGLKATEELRKIDPEAKIIMLSSIGMKEKITAAVKLGAKNFILKPFTEEKVMEIVNLVLGVS